MCAKWCDEMCARVSVSVCVYWDVATIMCTCDMHTCVFTM